MKVLCVKGLDVRYHMVSSPDKESIKEIDVINYFKSEGYNVFKTYSFFFRHKGKKNKTNKYIKKYHSDTDEKLLLLDLAPDFPQEVYNVFKKYSNGEPDILVEKDNIWEFIEIKTTNDSLRPNQIIFIEELSRYHKTSIQHFTVVTEEVEIQERKEAVVDAKREYNRGDLESIAAGLSGKYNADINKLKKLCTKRGFSKYWIVANLYKLYPDLLSVDKYITILGDSIHINNKSIKWYLSQNRKKILTDAIFEISKKKNITKRDETLLNYYKKIVR